MDREHKDKIKALIKSNPNPVALLDESLVCVYSNNQRLLPKETSFRSCIQTDIDFPVTTLIQTIFLRNGMSFCARISPYEDVLVCELFDANTLLKMAEDTDYYSKIMPIFNALEHNTARLWNTLFAVRDCINNSEDITWLDSRLYDQISELSSVIKNVSEYSMTFTHNKPVLIDIITLTEGVVKRCNTILAECGRCIDFVYDIKKMYIRADARHVINALINSLQNALLYSPRDSVPGIALSKCIEDGKEYIFIKVTNDNIFFVDKNFGENLELDFDFQRIGYGIPIIKRLAEETGGKFFLDDSTGVVKLGILIPADVYENGKLRVEEGGYSYYDTGIPDIIDVKMREVLNFFT